MFYITNPLGFTKKEFVIVFTILLLLVAIILANLQVSFRKSRDARRKADIGTVYVAVEKFQSDFGFFPLSDDQGRPLACMSDPQNPEFDAAGNVIYEPCNWGVDALRDVFDESYPAYLNKLPVDPHAEDGVSYYYISNGRRFQIYASLEGQSDPENKQNIFDRNINCGTRICNYGRSFGTTPLDKSLEEYENEISE